MIAEEVPLIVCVTRDSEVRERVARRLSDCGVVLMCTDVNDLRAALCLSAQADLATDAPGTPDRASASVNGGPLVAAAPVALGDLLMDPGNHVATWRGTPLLLTRLEWELLGRLATPPTTIWTYERLYGAVWGGAYLGDTSILHSAMKRLRRKLREAGDGLFVETVRGIGYRLSLTVP